MSLLHKTQIALAGELKKNDVLRSECNKIITLLNRSLKILQQSTDVEYSGDMILLKDVDGKWEFLGIYNPYTMECEEEPEGWDMCLPIPLL